MAYGCHFLYFLIPSHTSLIRRIFSFAAVLDLHHHLGGPPSPRRFPSPQLRGTGGAIEDSARRVGRVVPGCQDAGAGPWSPGAVSRSPMQRQGVEARDSLLLLAGRRSSLGGGPGAGTGTGTGTGKGGGAGSLVGFITAKIMYQRECDPVVGVDGRSHLCSH